MELVPRSTAGPIAAAKTRRTRDDQIEIFEWGAVSNGLGVDLYATFGASAEDMPGAERGRV